MAPSVSSAAHAPASSVVRLIGPGLLVAAAGAAHGVVLLWVVALAAFLKCVLNEGIARWQLATNTTAIPRSPRSPPA